MKGGVERACFSLGSLDVSIKEVRIHIVPRESAGKKAGALGVRVVAATPIIWIIAR
jgi:hypothetical protein